MLLKTLKLSPSTKKKGLCSKWGLESERHPFHEKLVADFGICFFSELCGWSCSVVFLLFSLEKQARERHPPKNPLKIKGPRFSAELFDQKPLKENSALSYLWPESRREDFSATSERGPAFFAAPLRTKSLFTALALGGNKFSKELSKSGGVIAWFFVLNTPQALGGVFFDNSLPLNCQKKGSTSQHWWCIKITLPIAPQQWKEQSDGHAKADGDSALPNNDSQLQN